MRNTNSVKNAIVYLFNAFVIAIISVVTTKIFGMFIDPRDYGVYSVFFGVFNLVLLVSFSILSQSMLRLFDDYKTSNQSNKFLSTIIASIIIVSLTIPLFTILVLGILTFVYDYEVENIRLIILFLVLFSFQGFYQVSLSLLRAKEMSKSYLLTNIVLNFLKLGIFIIVFFIIEKSVNSILYASILSMAIIDIFLLKSWGIGNFRLKSFDKTIFFSIVRYGFPLLLLPLINWILSTSDQLIILHYYGSDEVGIYSMGYRISSSIFTLFTNFIIFAYYPQIIKSFNREDTNQTSLLMKRLSLLYFLITIPIIIIAITNSKFIISLLSSVNYLDSSVVFSISSIGFVFLGYISFTNKPWELFKRNNMILVFTLLGAITNIILNLLFIPIFGYVFAAISTLISYLLIVILSLIFSRTIIKVIPDNKEILKLTFLAVVVYFSTKIIGGNSPDIIIRLVSITLTMLIYFIFMMILFRKNILNFVKYNKSANSN